jgi:hypothetical protein
MGQGFGGGFGRGPNYRAALANLITKLDLLTGNSLKLELNEEQKNKLRETLKDVDGKEDLSDDDAKAKVESLHKLLEGADKTLEAAGFRWPGDNPGRRPPQDDPLKSEDNTNHLKDLRQRLGQTSAQK